MRLYERYQNARDKAWAFLIERRIISFPLDIISIIESENILLISYFRGRAELERLGAKIENDAQSLILNGRPCIFFNHTMSENRLRFTFAHELGHIIMGHLSGPAPGAGREYNPFKEKEANIFARDILMPAIVCHHEKLLTAESISVFFGTSSEAAGYRAARMAELERRGAWGTSPLEREYERLYLTKQELI